MTIGISFSRNARRVLRDSTSRNCHPSRKKTTPSRWVFKMKQRNRLIRASLRGGLVTHVTIRTNTTWLIPQWNKVVFQPLMWMQRARPSSIPYQERSSRRPKSRMATSKTTRTSLSCQMRSKNKMRTTPRCRTTQTAKVPSKAEKIKWWAPSSGWEPSTTSSVGKSRRSWARRTSTCSTDSWVSRPATTSASGRLIESSR